MSIIKLELEVGDVSRLHNDIVIRLNLEQATACVLDSGVSPAKEWLFPFMERLISEKRRNGRQRTADTYRATLRSFSRFRHGEDIGLSELTWDVAKAYEQQLVSDGLSMNTVSFYLRKLRAAYNYAVDQGLVTDRQPFKRVHSAMCKTEKRAVSVEDIMKLKTAAASDKCEELARALFMFSFYTRGMSFVDLAFLKRSDVSGGYLRYRRHKTGQPIMVRWEQVMQEIVDRLAPQCYGDYLLPIISNGRSAVQSQYRGCQLKVNKALKRLGERLHLERKLTMYVARHSWATIARSIGISVGVISRAMGHTSERTTQIYLKSLDENVVDHANRSVIELFASSGPV